MATVADVERTLRERYPTDALILAEVPAADRSVAKRQEYVHFRASDVVWMEAVGDRRVQLHLMDGRTAVLTGELWRAMDAFRAMGFPFERTHRQVVVRTDRVAGIEQA